MTRQDRGTIDSVAGKVQEALSALGELWAREASVRTPRMADAISLLERGWRKLLKERDAKPKDQTTSETG